MAAEAGAVVDDTGSCPLLAGASLADVASADVRSRPWSDGSCEPDPALVAWLRAVHPTTTWTLSVGTGSSYLAAAGVLDGAAAATHWASTKRLTDAGVELQRERVVRAGQGPDLRRLLRRDRPGPDLARPQPRTGRRPDGAARPCSTTPNPPTTPAPRRRRPPTSASSSAPTTHKGAADVPHPEPSPRHDHTALRRPATPSDPPAPSEPPPRWRWPSGIGLLAGWAVSGFLFELAFVGSSCWGCCCWPRSRPWFGADPCGRCSFVTRPRSPAAGRESCWSPPSWSRYRQPWWSRRWAAAGTAGTPTTAGRRCSCSSSWPGPTSPRVASSSRCSSVR